MTAPLVLDASLAVAWMLAERISVVPAAEVVARHSVWVPPIWEAECVNAILHAVRGGRIEPIAARAAAADIGALPVEVDAESPPPPALLALATSHKLTAYDALYLELALRLGCPLATLDTPLRQAARRAGVAVVPRSA